MKRNKRLLFSGISIIFGLMLMRIAWFIINVGWSTAVVLMGSILFLGGVIVFALTFFRGNRRF